VRSVFILGVLAAIAAVAQTAAQVHIEWLWFRELGQESVFWTILANRWLTACLAGLGTTAFLLANLWLAERIAPQSARASPALRRRRILLPVYLLVAIGGGVLVASSVVAADWRHVLLWLHRSDFGVDDPLFHRDVGFFVFSLPLYRAVAQWLLLTVAAGLACSLVAHIATGAVRTKPPPISTTRGAHAHLLGLGALLLVIMAWRHQLGQFALALPRQGADLPGAAYTDVHVQLPWLRALVLISLAAAAMLVYGAARRSWALPTVALVVVAVFELANPAILPSVVQRFFVDPQTLSRERPYLANSIEFTQRAYDLDRVTERPLPANGTISPEELRSNRDVLRTVQLWDTAVVRPQIDQLQSIGSYYSFPATTFDRYPAGGRSRTTIVAPRELDLTRLEPSGRTWANDHLAYTHGYGLVEVPAARLDSSGQPTLETSDSRAPRPPLRLRQPRIYYGNEPDSAEPWVIARTNRPEIERPPGNAVASQYHYDGDGGIPLGGPLRRALLAIGLSEPNFVLSETLNADSRLMLHRDVGDRLRTLAPFLHWEDDADAFVVDGRIVFLVHGYTTSRSFPYSAPVELGDEQVNYVRASVVATVDSFSGRVELYATDSDDPLLRAWRGAFPSLFKPSSSMSPGVRAHLRYPRELFAAQSEIWETYHMNDVGDFYTRADAWQRPAEASGPISRVGAIRFESRDDEGTRMRPDFMLARLPGDRDVRFVLTTVYTPRSQENLRGYLAGSVDAGGGHHLVQLTLPRAQLGLGPSQVTRQILATPEVSDKLLLLNQETTDLGRQAVNTVELSQPRVVPIGDSFLYVQPIYVTAQGSGITRVRLVTVYLNGRVGYGRTLREALRVAGRA
jgi:uncharacterized membrane protein (UPF0182 family)